VKLRGFRIEPGEIESVLTEHPQVREAVVVVHDAGEGHKRLAAYLTPYQQTTLEVDELRGFLRENLPDFMIPAEFVLLDSLPLSPNGKVDRRRLPAPGLRTKTDIVRLAPRDEIERTIAEVWQEVLKLESVGVEDNFFDLGVDLFRHPTINSLASRLRQKTDTTFEGANDSLTESIAGGKNRLRSILSRGRQATNHQQLD
jgi:hypothetical protein